MNSASVPGGEPARRGSLIAQVGAEYVGSVCTGPPNNQFIRSKLPCSSHRVWQRSHIVTLSTMHLPRSIRWCWSRMPVSSFGLFACLAWAFVGSEASAANNTTVSESRACARRGQQCPSLHPCLSQLLSPISTYVRDIRVGLFCDYRRHFKIFSGRGRGRRPFQTFGAPRVGASNRSVAGRPSQVN